MKFARMIFLSVVTVCFNGYAESVDSDFYQQANPKIQLLVEHVQNEDFEQALAMAESFIKQKPDHPMGYFFQAAVYDTIIRDYSDLRYDSRFEKSVNKAIDLGYLSIETAVNRSDPSDTWIHFYLGASLGFRGLHRFFKRSIFSALKDGIKGLNQLDLVLEKKEDLYDAYYGLGCYYYWRSAYSKFLIFFPFMDKRDIGIKYLLASLKQGVFTKYESKNALLRVYINEKMFGRAIEIADSMSKEYPKDVFCLIRKGEALTKQEKWSDVAENYRKLLEIYSKSSYHCFDKICEIANLRIEALRRENDRKQIESTYQFVIREKNNRKQEKISRKAKKQIKIMKKIKESYSKI